MGYDNKREATIDSNGSGARTGTGTRTYQDRHRSSTDNGERPTVPKVTLNHIFLGTVKMSHEEP